MSTSTSLPRLADHVRACQVGDQLIFLDLLRSKYIGVGGPLLRELSEAILGDSATAGNFLAPRDLTLLDGRLERLRDQHLLSAGSAKQTAPPTIRLVEAVRTLPMDDEIPAGPLPWRALPRLWAATLVASWWLRHCNLADIAGRVVMLRSRRATGSNDPSPEAMAAAVAAYTRLRPLALTAHDRCLNDSLTLIHFLASRGLFPQWVIGVRVHPFAAHSWVQSGDIVLNDVAERVRHYRPILVV